MFTGIIEETGKVSNMQPMDGGIRLTIEAPDVTQDLSVGDSVAVNGVCLTAVAARPGNFVVEAVGETLEKTSLGDLDIGEAVNLERAMSGNGRFGGHFVQGHVNSTGIVRTWHRRGENYLLEVELPEELRRYVIPEGSIAIEGISLTVAALSGDLIGINIIPHTARVTNLRFKQPGDRVNIEVDVIAKYVENLLAYKVR